MASQGHSVSDRHLALDFTLAFGREAWRIFIVADLGSRHLAFASTVYGLGQFAGLSPAGLVSLAALFGALYLTIAVMFALHLASRIGALARRHTIDHDLLDAALILVARLDHRRWRRRRFCRARPHPDPAAPAAVACRPCRDAFDGRARSGNRRRAAPGYWERRLRGRWRANTTTKRTFVAPAARQEGMRCAGPACGAKPA